jgi:hypothetical protein
MPNLNFKEGRPIARIIGGKKDGKLLFLDEHDDDSKHMFDLGIKSLKFLEKDIKSILTKEDDEIVIRDGKLRPIPLVDTRETQRDVLYISGPAGSGKSTYAAEYIKEFKKIFPKADIFLFSIKESDKVLDQFKPHRIMLNDELLENPINPKELAHSLVIFDDIDTISNKKLLNEVRRLRDSILEVGRSLMTYCITTTHNLTAGTHTRMQLLESTAVTFYPKMGDAFHIMRFLKEYAGLDKKKIATIMSLKSRWVTIYKRAPNYCLYEHGAFLL